MKSIEDHHENIKECQSIFVSWSWMIVLIVAICGSIGAIAITYEHRETTQENSILSIQEKVEKIETIDNNIDTIKTLIRKGKL